MILTVHGKSQLADYSMQCAARLLASAMRYGATEDDIIEMLHVELQNIKEFDQFYAARNMRGSRAYQDYYEPERGGMAERTRTLRGVEPKDETVQKEYASGNQNG
jgi:hypothetical protein